MTQRWISWAFLMFSGCYQTVEPLPEGARAERPFCGDGQMCSSDPGDGEQICYYAVDDPSRTDPIAEVIYRFESTLLGESVRVALVLSEDFVDNTYGARSSSGYGRHDDKPHTFEQLVESDHSEFALLDAAGTNVLQIRLDYVSPSDEAPSGFRSWGVWGGEGEVVNGDPSAVLIASTSIDDNLNLRGCAFFGSSPSPEECPDWERRVIYTVWLAADAFGAAGFGRPRLDHIHASPSRMANTVDVEERPCPP
jgi:hypothetical protein